MRERVVVLSSRILVFNDSELVADIAAQRPRYLMLIFMIHFIRKRHEV